jgi:hypothetical protein
MTKGKRAIRSKEPLVWETVKPKVRVRVLLQRLFNARHLLEGIDSVSSIHQQICSIEESLKRCDTLFSEYDSRQIGYESFKTRLSHQLTAALLDDLKFLGCPTSSRCFSEKRATSSAGGVLDHIAAFEEEMKSGAPHDRQESKLESQGDFCRIVERLLVSIRSEGFGLEDGLKELYRWE